MKKFYAFIFIFLYSIFSSAPVIAEGHGTGSHILTVIGKVGNSNRAAFSAFHDTFLKYHDYSFEKAYAFDRAMLEALPQVTASAKVESWPARMSFKGPKLQDVMGAAGVDDDASLTFLALDGYSAVLDAQTRTADWVIALEADGKPLNIGGRGPLWLVQDVPDAEISNDAGWVWALFLIVVE